MPHITIDLLRRRAEHNEGCLSDLKEIALHQQDIEKIEVIGDACRQLEIIYLCNNYIPRIEGLRHLKWLKYLNLAVNNIKVIEGLEGCEALEKLDLTLNFIGDMTDIYRLRANPFLETLHLTGNPCTRTPGYRAYVVHTLPHLKDLDGSEVIKSERIAARQDEDEVTEVVDQEALKVREKERLEAEMRAKGIDPYPPHYNEKGERLYGHSAEERLQMLQEQQEMEAKKKKEADTPIPGSISAIHKELQKKAPPLTQEEELKKFGRLLMRNEGKVPFQLEEEPGAEEVILTVRPGKFIATSLLEVKVDVQCLRVWVKGKLLQVPLQTEVAADEAKVQRSTTTGELKLTVPIASHLRAMSRQERLRAWRASVQQLEERSKAFEAAAKKKKEEAKENTPTSSSAADTAAAAAAADSSSGSNAARRETAEGEEANKKKESPNADQDVAEVMKKTQEKEEEAVVEVVRQEDVIVTMDPVNGRVEDID